MQSQDDGFANSSQKSKLPTLYNSAAALSNELKSVADSSASVPIPDRGHGKITKAMDPFEVRIRFTQHLQHLNASVTSANKAAQYAIKYRDMDEDLHSCILEQLERVCTFLYRI
jgi:hypothetical protein